MAGEIISAVALIIVAIIEVTAARDRKKSKEDRERSERRAEDRATESRLSMKMMDASLELGMATALAVEQHKLNGEMRRAKEKAADAQGEYSNFVCELAARQVAKI